MPKRSQKYPCRVSESEQKRYCQVRYNRYKRNLSKIRYAWLKDNYGVKEVVK